MESRNSVWTKLCVTVGRTTTKVNAHFVPRFFICFHAVSTQSTGMQGALAGSLACSTSRFSLSGYLRHGYKKCGDRIGVKLNNIIPILHLLSVSLA